jgi:hypothetical protein
MRGLLRVLAMAVLLAVLASCAAPFSTGLSSLFGSSATGSTILVVREGVPVLTLGGTVRVDTGDLTVTLTPPHGPAAFNLTYGTGTTVVDQDFASPEAGTWTLSVSAGNPASGRYDLRLSY